jgi:hypothetical protein
MWKMWEYETCGQLQPARLERLGVDWCFDWWRFGRCLLLLILLLWTQNIWRNANQLTTTIHAKHHDQNTNLICDLTCSLARYDVQHDVGLDGMTLILRMAVCMAVGTFCPISYLSKILEIWEIYIYIYIYINQLLANFERKFGALLVGNVLAPQHY